MRLQWINRDHDLIAKRTLWVRFHYYFKKKKGGTGSYTHHTSIQNSKGEVSAF